MGDRSADVVAHLPASLVRVVAANRTRGLPWCDEVDGTMVMADLSGFTALSERLARLGDEGAERLTEIINSFFARMLETAFLYGGDTLTFGGDAILVMFDGAEHATRAAAASLAMLKQVERAAAVDSGEDKVKIGMSVGAHSAVFLLAAAGLVEERANLLVLGRGAELTARAEAQAERGELAVSSATRDLLPEGSAVTAAGDFWRVDELSACVLPRVAAERPQVSEEQLRQLAPFLPLYARAGIEGGGGRVQHAPEHRRTVIVFVNIIGLNEIIESAGIDAALGQLQTYSAMLTRLAATHRGFVVSSDIATQGSKLVITFGTPVAHEYAPANAARFALDLNDGLLHSGLDLQHKIGLNGGHVFAGEVGPASRRQYTVMGDAVNLAARMMSAAQPGEALISRNLLDYVSPDLCARELAPIKVKGKEQPVGVCVLERERRAGGQVRGGAGAGSLQGRLFGRRAELEVMQQRWEQSRAGHGSIVLVEGEAGVGKTRLLEEALHALPDAALVTRAACFEHLQAAPFTPWVDALYSVLEVSREEPTERRTEKVRVCIEENVPELAELGSLLNPLLNVSLPQSQVVGSLDAQTRRQKLFELITHILTEAADGRGHVIVLEDLHWVDESSLALAAHLARHVAETLTLLLLTSRPTEAPANLEGAEVTQIVLAELSQAESLAMVREALSIVDLPVEVGEAVYAKTKGNPLFLEEVVHSLEAPGVLERILSASSVTRAAELTALEIPDRVQGLLMSRIDRLPPDTREVLKAGSVVGRSFDAEVLAGIDDDLLRPVSLERAFDELVAAALVIPSEEAGGPSVIFRHALVQDVAYDSLPFARRRGLHASVARYLETVSESPDHAVLVHHYRHAGDEEKTRLHAVRASESSVAVVANVEAVDYLDVALATAQGRTSQDACFRSRFEELMGDSLVTLARHDDAIACFVHARRRWSSQRVRQIAEEALSELAPIEDADGRDSLLCWKIARSLDHGRAAYKRALRWLEKATSTLPHDNKGLEARIVVAKSGVYTWLGRLREAVEFGERGLALARKDGDLALQAYALTLLGHALDRLGLLDRAIECNTEAIALYEQAGDLLGQARAHPNLASCYIFKGDLRAALEHDELALALFARLGNVNGLALEQINVGAVLVQMGETEAAIEHLEEGLSLRGSQGVDPGTVGFGLALLGLARVQSGDLEAAQEALSEGRAVLEGIQAHGMLLDAEMMESELRLAQGDLAEAERLCNVVLSEARSMGASLSEAQALCMLGRIKLAQGDPGAGMPGLQACLALTEEGGFAYEHGQALAVLAEAQTACDEGDPACEDLLSEAIHIFEKMGARYDLEKAEALRARLESLSPSGG